MKVKVEAEVEIPTGKLVYDIGGEVFHCVICGANESFKIIDRPSTRCAGPSTEQAFKDFVGKHAQCVGRHRERQIREEASQPCRQDYRDARGGGPHECGKADGHGGACGPG